MQFYNFSNTVSIILVYLLCYYIHTHVYIFRLDILEIKNRKTLAKNFCGKLFIHVLFDKHKKCEKTSQIQNNQQPGQAISNTSYVSQFVCKIKQGIV